MTRRACVIGWPVAHSRSPVIHGYWLERYGIDGTYEKEAVSPAEIDNFLRELGSRGYVGANVTLPHKEAALRAARSGCSIPFHRGPRHRRTSRRTPKARVTTACTS